MSSNQHMMEHFEQYCELRDQGYSVWNAAYRVGVSDETGRKYERARKKLQRGETLAVQLAKVTQ